ncbi:MAG TPA: dephospho-CoA kinase [Propionibacterium sp.]|nr:dephospho-CoA kinase [Propionibacterium sp.]
MARIALTGGIASGKSAVADLLAARGAVLVDSDVLAREVVAPGTPGLAAIVERFGEGILRPDGALDRPALGAIVFADPDARADLEAITHPRIRARAGELRAEAPAGAVVIDVIPLLVEGDLSGRFDEVIVVDVPEEVQVERLRRRDGFTRDEAMARLAAQASREDRLAVADHVIDNSGDTDALAAQVDRLWDALRRG